MNPKRYAPRGICDRATKCPAASGATTLATGTLAGEIGRERRGDQGFGYDPIFVPLGESRTVAELGNAWKTEHSHRADAARALAQRLRER